MFSTAMRARAVVKTHRTTHTTGEAFAAAMAATLVLVLFSGLCFAADFHTNELMPAGHAPSSKTGFAEARFGYLWGLNVINLRDGDNALIPPSKRDIELQGLLFGLAAGKFFSQDLGARVLAWIDVPQQVRCDFYIDGAERTWEVRPRFIAADISGIYRVGPLGMPLTAGLIAGYRYTDLDYDSRTASQPPGTLQDHFQIHIPYLGVYYANTAMFGSVVRLDVIFSPLTLCRLDSNGSWAGAVTQIQGASVTGHFFETYFNWSWPLSDSVLAGIFGNYTYLDLAGGATVVRGGRASTRFSMDSNYNIGLAGITLTYTF